MKKLSLAIILLTILNSLMCSWSEKRPETVVKKDSVEKVTIKNDTTLRIRKELTTKSGKKFIITESKPSISVSNYVITGAGFENSNDSIIFDYKNPMVTTFLADLDKNGFDEVYIITKATETGDIQDVLAVASYDDKSFGAIDVDQISSSDVQKNEKFGGYLGHDSIYITENSLIREFPVYANSDLSKKPTGERKKIVYSLKSEKKPYELVVTDAGSAK